MRPASVTTSPESPAAAACRPISAAWRNGCAGSMASNFSGTVSPVPVRSHAATGDVGRPWRRTGTQSLVDGKYSSEWSTVPAAA